MSISDNALLGLIADDADALRVLTAFGALGYTLVDAEEILAYTAVGLGKDQPLAELSRVHPGYIRSTVMRLKAAKVITTEGVSELADKLIQSRGDGEPRRVEGQAQVSKYESDSVYTIVPCHTGERAWYLVWDDEAKSHIAVSMAVVAMRIDQDGYGHAIAMDGSGGVEPCSDFSLICVSSEKPSADVYAEQEKILLVERAGRIVRAICLPRTAVPTSATLPDEDIP